MKISRLVATLKAAQEKHGDLPVFTSDGSIDLVGVYPCVDGVERTTDGVPETPNEITLEFTETV